MIALDYSLAIDADDPTQRAWAVQKVSEREARQRELWRWLMTQKMGREWISDVLLPALGPAHHLGGGTPEQLYGEVALHNLACRWLAQFLLGHRDLYLQMQAEALKREESDRKELEAQRAEWRRQQMASPGSESRE